MKHNDVARVFGPWDMDIKFKVAPHPMCSGSVVVTAYDFESGRPGSNPEWEPIYYEALIPAQGLLEPSSLRGRTLGTRTEHKGMQNDWWLQPCAVFSHTISGIIWHMSQKWSQFNCMTLSWWPRHEIVSVTFTFTHLHTYLYLIFFEYLMVLSRIESHFFTLFFFPTPNGTLLELLSEATILPTLPSQLTYIGKDSISYTCIQTFDVINE